MIQATITGKRQVEFFELPDPKAKGDWVLVKVHASALCQSTSPISKARKC